MKIESKIKDYCVEIKDNVLMKKEEVFFEEKYRKLYFFIDENVFNIYKEKILIFVGDSEYLVIPAQEDKKDYLQLAEYYKCLIDKGFMRTDILVTIGGGILQDLSGFIASTLYRGLKWVFLPTTLLAQADSCIGSKTSINFSDSKNLIGSFYPPDKIFIDPEFCMTLTKEYFNSGVGELIKFHLMDNDKSYVLLRKFIFSTDTEQKNVLKEIILSNLEIKKSYFAEDEFDSGRRNLLNYGHCFGHALESASNFEVCHGEAVIVGMSFADLLALHRGFMSKEKYDEYQLIYDRHYPNFGMQKVSVQQLIDELKKDKKRVGKDLTMILSKDIGEQKKFDDITEEEIVCVYNEFLKKYSKYKRIGV